ncbi:MAG: molybdate ABC transporter substrate-binding protein [Pseudomonas sp.]|jgi:molybdate transport system substrate-binding protein|nr:molybdate ABC transporter substrate-binding protein [Pseudomonas sp.]MDY0414240.1 molybdate ABC transporter substrate-binding protein [Pseudomonas sp.]NLO53089.1 molybdate ABC transporter substrate-binding protein [Gammaproteobacteria bacterium]
MLKSHLKHLFAIALISASGSVLAAEVTVSAASSLTNAFKDIAANFEAAHPEHKVLLNFAGSGELLQQISKGAPVDVFASADQETMDKAQAQGLLTNASRRDFVHNTLVVITPANSSLKLTQLSDLQRTDLQRLAVSNPDSVPVGRYSKQALLANNLWDVLVEKMINTQNVRQSLDYVARDEVDAGFVYATDAAIMADKVKVQFTVPLDTVVSYPIAVTKEGSAKALSQQFIDYTFSEDSQAVLSQYGFSQP